MKDDIKVYFEKLDSVDLPICTLLLKTIDQHLPQAENKVWHAHPVWFLDGNPIVGFSKEKSGIRLMFWSGADFAETQLNVVGKKFKDASIFFSDVSQIDTDLLKTWLEKSKTIQWDYKNIVKKKGLLEKIS